MCTHCGCSSEKARISEPGTTAHQHLTLDSDSLQLKESLLAGNDSIAAENQQLFKERHILCVNLMGTPGAGKTQLLEATLRHPDFKKSFVNSFVNRKVNVLEGDQQTSNDAKRIQNTGAKVLQINTGEGCHLDADMVQKGIASLAPEDNSLLVIENVGNLVCPALFQLGETCRIAMMSLTDGEDKPIKYPHMFRNCDLVLLNKIDLAPYLDVDTQVIKQHIATLNPNAQVIELSAKTGEGMSAWLDWLKHQQSHTQNPHA
jgi:hydrogenase nickel incorporation protein HypB